MVAVQTDMPHHASGFRGKKSCVKALTKYTGRGHGRGIQGEGELCYRFQMPPKLYLVWELVEPSGLFRGQFRGFV